MEAHCVFGPPGCGKTQYLIDVASDRIKKLARILFLSFTKAAAAEAASRIDCDRIIPSTIHAFAYRALNLSSAQVVDERKLIALSAEIGIPVRGPGEDALQVGDEYIDVISFAQNMMITEDDAYDLFNRPGTPREFLMFSKAYKSWKEAYGYVDFDDMLLGLIAQDVTVPPGLVLDEAQDCSRLQWMAIRKLAHHAKEVYLAGDDDQAIYEWSGADPHGMNKFGTEFRAKVTVLDQSWRMPPSIHDFVHHFILKEFTSRQDKTFAPRIGGKDGGVTRYNTFNDYPVRVAATQQTLMLVRDRFRMLDAKKILNAQTIPYRVTGSYSPFENTKAHAIRAVLKSNAGEPLSDAEAKAAAVVLNRSAILKGDYSAMLGRDWRDIITMSENQRSFYESVDLFEPINITLSTIHQAKGRESDHVVVDLELTPRVIENMYKNRDSELRVMYVACTRARESLSLCAENPLI